MARRKARMPQGKKLQPAPLTMTFGLTVPEDQTNTDNYIDLSQCASLINRRFYRQGLNWAVSGFSIGAKTDGSANAEGFVRIYKVPQTWVASNAWEKGFRAWQKMNNQALDEVESIRPKFLDFKVYMDSGHHQAGSASNLIPLSEVPIDPLDATIGSYKLGEWEYSSYKIPYTDNSPGNIADREIIWTGGNYPGISPVTGANAISLIEGYAASRGLPDVLDPNAPDDAADADGISPENWMSALFNDGTNQDDRVLGDMIDENNLAPYPFENDGTNTDTQYPGGANNGGGLEIHYIQPITGTTVGGISQSPGGTFYGGLIKVQTAGALATGPGSVLLQVHLVPGPHRGYMCQPMQDV